MNPLPFDIDFHPHGDVFRSDPLVPRNFSGWLGCLMAETAQSLVNRSGGPTTPFSKARAFFTLIKDEGLNKVDDMSQLISPRGGVHVAFVDIEGRIVVDSGLMQNLQNKYTVKIQNDGVRPAVGSKPAPGFVR